MADDHEVRIECLKRFERLEANDREMQKHHEADMVVTARLENKLDTARHETERAFQKISGDIGDIKVDLRERMVAVEGSTRSAHYRIDGQNKAIWIIVGSLLTIIGTAVIAFLVLRAGG